MSMFKLSRWLCQANVFVLIFDLVQHVAHYFVVAIGTISCCLGRRYGPVFSLSFLDAYVSSTSEIAIEEQKTAIGQTSLTRWHYQSQV